MKLPCEIVEDLLPLYEDNVCSPISREAVEEHLKECDACRSLAASVRELPLPEPAAENASGDGVAVKSFRKIRRRWMMSVIAVILVIPIAVALFSGVRIGNIDEIYYAERFFGALKKGDYQKAAELMEFGSLYDEMLQDLKLTEEDLMPEFAEVEIDGESWLARESVAERFIAEDDAYYVWRELVYSGEPFCLIPEDVWERIAAEYGSSERELIDLLDGEGEINGQVYWRIETRWGVFMVSEDIYDMLEAGDFADAAWSLLELMPLLMYDDLEEKIRSMAQANLEEIWERYEFYCDMEREEFIEYMKEDYANSVEYLLSEEVSLTRYSFNNAYDVEGRKVVSMLVEFESLYFDGVYTVYYELTVNDGKLSVYSIAYPGGNDIVEPFAHWLSPNYNW